MPERPRYELVIAIGEELRVVDLGARGEVVLGRDPGNDVQLDHPSVSRRHARLQIGAQLTAQDLGSANGTFLHEKLPADVPGGTTKLRRLLAEPAPIALGESLLLGAVGVLVRRVAEPSVQGFIVEDAAMRELYAQAARAAAASISVLLLGPTGVGKEVLARHVHALSPRASGPFVGINCAAISEQLFESELFGYEKGAFTGATHSRAGLIESAAGGSLFLDELGELPLPTQTKLLRVIEERAVLRVGARVPRAIDVRFIGATHRELEQEVRAGRFREDLFYRLNGISLTIPALRERPVEIEPLANSFLQAFCRQLERLPMTFSDAALQLMRAHAWPGNVRELRNVVERAIVLCPGSIIGPEFLPSTLNALGAVAKGVAPSPAAELGVAEFEAQLASLERARIVAALERCAGNQTQAAKLLGLARRTLVARLVDFGIPRPRTRSGLR